MDLGAPVSVAKIGGYLGRSEVFAVDEARGVLKVFHDNAARKKAREMEALLLLDGEGLPIPHFLGEGIFSDGEPWILMSHLPGGVMEDRMREMDAPEVPGLFAAMGSLLASVHRLDDAAVSSLPRQLPPRERYATYRAHVLAGPAGTPGVYAEAAERMAELEEMAGDGEPELFVHGDFGPRNILVEHDGNGWGITGLIDFERAHPGDPIEDFAMLAFKEFIDQPERRRAFLRAYREVRPLGENAPERLAYHLFGLFFEIAKWAYNDDRAYYERSTLALERLLAGDPAFMLDEEM